MTIIINPGSGPVADAAYEDALANMRVFCADAQLHSLTEVKNPDQGDGRFKFFACNGAHWHEIDMPGLPLQAVRYMDSATQNIWDFPRLYVDGSSWVWRYAIKACADDGDAG